MMNLHPFIFWPLVILFGLVIGSYLHVMVDRIPRMMKLAPLPTAFLQKQYNLAWPRSHCPHCGTVLGVRDLIPLLSYFMLRGKCRYCHQPIALSYPIMEVTTAVAFVIVVAIFGINLAGIAAMFLTAGLLVLGIIDYRYHILPDSMTMTLLWLGLLVNLGVVFVPLEDALIGAIAGYMSLWLVFHVHHYLTGRMGLGHGDFKLLALLGAWLGWQSLPLIVVIASASGLLYAGYEYTKKRLNRHTPLPLGTFLALAGWIVLIVRWYYA